MNSKHLLLTAAAFLPLWAAVSAADQKNDISDPVLQQVIQSFSGKMPRFLDKHGKSIFVSDESVTRGSLLMALYEYDKSAKGAQSPAGGVSRKEFEDLRNKLNLISSGEQGATGGAAASSDIIQILNALEPNMPTLLDSTLGKSKVFTDLKRELTRTKAGGQGIADTEAVGSSDETMNALAGLQKDMKEVKHRIDSLSLITVSNDPSTALSDLRQRVERIELNPPGKAPRALDKTSAGIDAASASDIKRSLARAQSDISELKNKVKGLENETAEAAPSPGAGSGYASALTKISLGLSMVAAFFIAR